MTDHNEHPEQPGGISASSAGTIGEGRAMTEATTYIAVRCQLSGNLADYTCDHSPVGVPHDTREAAWKAAFAELGHDDFRIATLIGGKLAAIGYGYGQAEHVEDFGAEDFAVTEEDLSEIARQLALDLHPTAVETMVGVYFDTTCMDCVAGWCHWGGAESERSEQAVRDGQEYASELYGPCGCARHSSSVAARRYQRDGLEATATAWCAAIAHGDVEATEDDDGEIVIAGPIKILNGEGGQR